MGARSRSVWLVTFLSLATWPALSQDRATRSTTVKPARAKPAPVAVSAVEIVTITAANGNRVSFLEPEAGVMLIVEQGKYPNESVLEQASIREQESPVAVYRALQPQQAVPARLQQAEQRLVVRAAPTEEDPEEPPVVQAGKTVQVAAIPAQPAPVQMKAQKADTAPAKTGGQAPMDPGQKKQSPMEPAKQQKPETDTRAAWFQNKFCSGGGGTVYTWCWLDRTGSSKQQRWSFSMAPVVYSCGGTVRLKFQYKRFGKWKDYVSRDVLPGYYYRASRYGIWRTRRARVVSADGDCYHFAGAGIR